MAPGGAVPLDALAAVPRRDRASRIPPGLARGLSRDQSALRRRSRARRRARATVWIHDYQLQHVPALLREQRPDLHTGFFLHIPFPPPELFTQLPDRDETLRGVCSVRTSSASDVPQVRRTSSGCAPISSVCASA